MQKKPGWEMQLDRVMGALRVSAVQILDAVQVERNPLAAHLTDQSINHHFATAGCFIINTFGNAEIAAYDGIRGIGQQRVVQDSGLDGGC
ncbi:hypothetical protein CF597_26290 [Pseudomonas sp. PSB1]|nr:hypothetical protein [Pseudomonas sp. PSB1]